MNAFRIPIILLGLAVASPAATVMFKEQAINPLTSLTYTGTEDAWLFTNGPSSGTGDRNTGGDGRVIMGGDADETSLRNQLIRFDVTSLTGLYSSINSAKLRLYWQSAPASTSALVSSNTVRVHQLASANTGWVEGTGGPNDDPSPGAFSTWDQRVHGGASWTGSPGAMTAGTDYLTPVIASTAYNLTPAVFDPFDLVFTDLSFLPSWIAGTNAGLFMKPDPFNVFYQVIFHSSENVAGASAYTPELIIDYTAVPEPTRATLLVFGLAGLLLRRRR